nr:hypothetical protein StreXyl84_04790 [Streptomyces sp. Xyl84]
MEGFGQGGGERRLADARVPLAEDRPVQAQRQEAGDGEPVVDEVAGLLQAGARLLGAVDGGDRRSPRPGGGQDRPLGEDPGQVRPVLG